MRYQPNFAKLKSVWADEIIQYLEERQKSGFEIDAAFYHIKHLDRYCEQIGLKEKIFTDEMAFDIKLKLSGESGSNRYGRVSETIRFLQYLRNKGYDVHIPPPISTKNIKKYPPYIYTYEELANYMNAVDTFDYGFHKLDSLIMAVFFGLIYCYGLRISEVKYLRKKDIDFKNKVIKISKSKNGKERWLPMSIDIERLLSLYAKKTFFFIRDDTFIFNCELNTGKNHIDPHNASIYRYHYEFLHLAGIHNKDAESQRPRIHDFRHTAAVHIVKQLSDKGYDVYTIIPYLIQFLGHSMLRSTEYYIKLSSDLFPEIREKMNSALQQIVDAIEVPYEID